MLFIVVSDCTPALPTSTLDRLISQVHETNHFGQLVLQLRQAFVKMANEL